MRRNRCSRSGRNHCSQSPEYAPLRFLDPDGHQEVTSDALLRAAKDAANDPVGTVKAGGSFVKEYWKGEFKALGNIGIGVNNLGAIALRHPEGIIQPFDPNGSDAEFMGYKAMSMLTLLSPALSEVGPAGVLTAEAKQTTAAAAEIGNAVERATTLKPGPFATESIPARGPQRSFTVSERNAINEIGLKSGCQTCGTTNPGTRSGNFIPDHQPPSALNLTNGLQRLFPHCNSCSHRQAGEVTAAKRFNPGGHKF